ncbi:MAG: hypothetical protein JRE40_02090 [Deltaproteobacteria bacterium]|nr:hypothetical protein [Deltaproteobacteria bacterium]MBW2672542.1 hypothetical protein [Deltaproteobacteria bacterium]
MAVRHKFSGYNDEALTTTVKSISSDADFATKGRVFWLKGISISNTHASETGLVDLYDQDEGAIVAANQRGSILCPPNSTTVVDYPAPGIKFATEVGAVLTNGTVGAYDVLVTGYEE